MTNAKEFILYMIKPEFMKKKMVGETYVTAMQFKDTLHITTPSKVRDLWATRIFKTMYSEFLRSGDFDMFAASDETLN